MNRHELLERHEIRGDETDYLAAKPLYEQALAGGGDPQLLLEYGYLLECHARNELRQAVARYQRAVELDPDFDKAWYQLIHALAALDDSDELIALHQRRLAQAPQEVREYRFLAAAYLVAGRSAEAREVIDAGLRLAPDDRMLISQRGEAKASTGDPDGALADWHHALDLDNSDIGPLFSALTSSSAKDESTKQSGPGSRSSAGTSNTATSLAPNSRSANWHESASTARPHSLERERRPVVRFTGSTCPGEPQPA